MAFSIRLGLLILWLTTLITSTQSNASIPHHDGSSPFVSPLIEVPTNVGQPTSSYTSPISSLPFRSIDEYPMPSSIPHDHILTHIGSKTSPSHSTGHSHDAHMFLHRSRRGNIVSRLKCARTTTARKVGYYLVSNVRELRCHRIMPAQIVTTGLSHLYLAYAGIDPKTFSIIPSHPEDVALYKEFTARKTASMQIWIAVGGFDFSNDGPTRQTWSVMAARSESRAAFIASLGKFMKDYGFQGVDLDWEYPSAGDRGGSINDAANYVALVRELRAAWGKTYGISATLPPGPYLRGFDPKGMQPYVDFFNFISYDIRGSSEASVRPHTDIREIEKEAAALWAAQLDAKKINLGLSNYGRGYTLADRTCSHSGCKVSGPSKPAPCTGTAGLMSNIEISDIIQQKKVGARTELIPNTMSKQLVWDDQWISYDDGETMAQKTDWAADNCFGGTMIWTLDMNSGEGSGSTPIDIGHGQTGQPSSSARPLGFDSLGGPSSSRQQASSGAVTTTRQSVPVTPLPVPQGNSRPQSSTSARPAGVSTKSGQSAVPVISVPSRSTTPTGSSTSPPTPSRPPTVPVLPIPAAPSQSTTPVSTSTKSSISSGNPIVSKLPVPAAPGQSSTHVSTSTRTSANTGRQTVPSQSAGLSSSSGPAQSGKPSPSSKSVGTTAPNQVSAAALVIPGIVTIPSPTISPSLMVTEGSSAVLGLIPLAVGIQKGMSQVQEPMIKLVQSNPPKVEDAKRAISFLARIYALQQTFGKEITLINVNTLPPDAKKVIQQIKNSWPGIQAGTKDSINHLATAIKDPVKIKRTRSDEIHQADQLVGKQGSVTQQVTRTLQPLTDWKPPSGSNDIIILPGLLSLANPTLGDNWKGTTIPGTLSIPSPTLHWDQSLMFTTSIANNAGSGVGSSSGSGGSGAGDGGSGGDGASSLSHLLGLAKQAESAVHNAATALTSLSGQSSPSGSDLSNLVSLLTSSAEDVGGLGAGLDAIEMQTFPPADIDKVVNIQNANRSLFAELKDTLNALARYITRPPEAIQTLKQRAPAFAVGGTVFGLLALSDSAAISALFNTRAASIVPPLVPSSNSTTKKPAQEYFLLTLPGTPVEAYQKFILTLPDKGVGEQRHYEWPDRYQTYLGNMTQQEARAVSENKIVEGIVLNKKKTLKWSHGDARIKTRKRSGLSRSKQQRSNGTRLAPRALEQRPESELHLRMISCDPQSRLRNLQATMGDPQFDYQHDDTSGRGATVYIIDDGFKFTHQDFDRGEDLEPRIHVPARYGDVSVSSGSDHGDPIAALAVGDLAGVANQAYLVGVKAIDRSGDETVAGAYDNWNWIISDVQARVNAGTTGRLGKAVINYSNSWEYTDAFGSSQDVNFERWGLVQPEIFDIFLPLLARCWMADIVTVFAVGNIREEDNEDTHIGHISPQRYANPYNPMIIVGAVDRYGVPSDVNRIVGPTTGARGRDVRLTGEITVYALGDDVDIIDAETEADVDVGTGTSFAAPQVAGLAAYYFSLPGLQFSPGQVAMQMKTLIFNSRRQGSNHPNSPDGPNIAYNNADRLLDYCVPGTNVRAKPRGWPIDFATISDYLVTIFKRQKKKTEITIFKDGRLTDPKYSDRYRCKLPGGYQPKPTWSSKTMSSSSSSKLTASSKPKSRSSSTSAESAKPKPTSSAPKPAPPKPSSSSSPIPSAASKPSPTSQPPPPAPPRTPTVKGPSPKLPKPSNLVCYSLELQHPAQTHRPQVPKGAETTFKRSDMLKQILDACNTATDWGFEVADTVNKKRLVVRSAADDGTIFKKEKNAEFDPQKCVDGFVTGMDSCDKSNDEQKWGGEVIVQANFFYLYAGTP